MTVPFSPSPLQNKRINGKVQIRLDPFRFQPIENHRHIKYKMRDYGDVQLINWEKIRKLKADQFGKWIPDPPNYTDIEFTDVCWQPRKGKIHFVCEEIPNSHMFTQRGSRYLHAIYNPDSDEFSHVDGALRFYKPDELINRGNIHVRKGEKWGTRVKIFQIDGSIDKELWCGIASSFFVWSKDMEDYFNGRKMLEEGL